MPSVGLVTFSNINAPFKILLRPKPVLDTPTVACGGNSIVGFRAAPCVARTACHISGIQGAASQAYRSSFQVSSFPSWTFTFSQKYAVRPTKQQNSSVLLNCQKVYLVKFCGYRYSRGKFPGPIVEIARKITCKRRQYMVY